MLKGDARQSIVCKSSVSSGWTCLLIHTWEVGAVWQLFANHPYHPEGPAHQYIRGPCSATVVWKSSVSSRWTDLLIHKRSARCGNFLQIILIILMDQPFEVGAVWQLFANHPYHPDGPAYRYIRGPCGVTVVCKSSVSSGWTNLSIHKRSERCDNCLQIIRVIQIDLPLDRI